MPTLDVGATTLGYDRTGSGWPLVMLHGGWLDRELWAPQRERFADGFEVVTVDLRDHGESDGGDGDYAVADLAADVGGLVDALGLADPVVCGLSLGGLVAQRVGVERPDRVAGLVLADTVTSVPPVTLPPGVEAATLPRTTAGAAVRWMGPGAYFRSLVHWIEAAEGRRWLATTDAAREYAFDAVDEFDRESFLRVLDALAAHEPVDNGTHDLPTLVVHGDHETRAVVRQNEALAETMDAERVVIPDAGHLVNRDDPAAFGDAVESFLDDQVTVPA